MCSAAEILNSEREAMEYDVCIVGGGPAGLAAAIRLRQVTVSCLKLRRSGQRWVAVALFAWNPKAALPVSAGHRARERNQRVHCGEGWRSRCVF